MARRHEKAVALYPPEAEVRAAPGQGDSADYRAVGGEDHDAVALRAHAPAAPQIAVNVTAEPVRRAALQIGEIARVGEPVAVTDDIIDLDVARLGARFYEIE